MLPSLKQVRLPKKRAKMRSSGVAIMPAETDPVPLRIKGNIFVKSAGIDGKAGEKQKQQANQPGFLRR